tara:strand:+ start:3421 stop:4563 length:1143 start_codon:yes stop_codon:yes gene_type:complete
MKTLTNIIFLLFTLTIFSQGLVNEDEKLNKKIERKYKTKKIIDDVFKYATFYGAYNQSNSFQVDQTYFVTQENELINTTIPNPYDYNITYGIRKLSHFAYEDRNNYYDGSESNVGRAATIGNIKNGLEYLVEFSKGRQQNKGFENKEAFVRYLSKWWLVKGEYKVNELIDLDFTSAELRGRIMIGKRLSLSLGGIYRKSNKAYGYIPIQDYLETNNWWNLAYDYFNYTDQVFQLVDPFTNQIIGYDYLWFNEEGQQIAASDNEFRRTTYGRLVNLYNEEQLSLIDSHEYLSAVVGLDYYYQRQNIWFHFYGNLLPYHKLISGDKNYWFGHEVGNEWNDYTAGGVFGVKIWKNLGIYTELTMQKYWDRELKEISIGINYQI